MRTTLNIDAALLAQAMKALGSRTKTDAVENSLRAAVALAAARELIALGGKLPRIGEPPRRRRAAPAHSARARSKKK